MKITKQRLKQIIREELQAEAEEDAMLGAVRPGAGIEDIPQPEDEETVDRAFDSPEGRLITLIQARKVLGNMTREELKDLATDLDASMVATLRHILSNKMYAPMGGQGDEMELEEYRGGADAAQSQKRMRDYRGGDTRSANQGSGRPDSATRSANTDARQEDPSKSPYGRSR